MHFSQARPFTGRCRVRRWFSITYLDRLRSHQAFLSLPQGVSMRRNVQEVRQSSAFPRMPGSRNTRSSLTDRFESLYIAAKSLLIPTGHTDEFQAEFLLDGPADCCHID